MIALWCRFRSQGMQWPLRPGDTVEVRRDGVSVGELPAEFVIDLIAHHLYGLRLQEQFRDGVRAETARKPLTPVPLEVQAARRAKRRQNSIRRKP